MKSRYRMTRWAVALAGAALAGAGLWALPVSPAQPAASPADYQTQLEIEEIKDRVRSLYAQNQYEQVLQELERLEQIKPDDPAIDFYRQLTERRLRNGPPRPETPAAAQTPAISSAPDIPPPPPPVEISAAGQTPAPSIVQSESGLPAGPMAVPATSTSGAAKQNWLLWGLAGIIALAVGLGGLLVFLLVKKRTPGQPSQSAQPGASAPAVMPPLPASTDPYGPPPGGPGIGPAPIGSVAAGALPQAAPAGPPAPPRSIAPVPVPGPSPTPPSAAGRPVELSPGDYEEVSAEASPVSPAEAGRSGSAPVLFGSGAPPEADTDSGKMPVIQHTMFEGGASPYDTMQSVEDVVGSLGGFDAPRKDTPDQKPDTASAGSISPLDISLDLPAETAFPPSVPPAQPGRSEPQPSSISFDFDFSEDRDRALVPPAPSAAPPVPLSPPPQSSAGTDEIVLDDLSLDFGESSPSAPSAPLPEAPVPGQPPLHAETPPSATVGVSLDDFLFSGDLKTNVPAVSAPLSPPPMAGESQFPEPGEHEPASESEEMMFSGLDQTTAPSSADATVAATIGGTSQPRRPDRQVPQQPPNISEDITLAGDIHSAPGPEEEPDDVAPVQHEKGRNFITDGDTKTVVSEETRILSPKDFGVFRMKSSAKSAASPEAPTAAQSPTPGEKTPSTQWNFPKPAGPSDKTTFLADGPDDLAASKKEAAGAGTKTSDSLFDKHFAQGLEAFESANWKEAIYHLNVAYTLKPHSAEVRDKLREARRRRKEARSTD